MKLNIVGKDGEKGSVDLPSQFNTRLREDVIKRAVEAEQANARQPYGASKDAGMRHSTFLSKRRSDYRNTYGIGQSRTPRKIMSRSGSRMNYTGAFAPMTVGGRRAHPPKADKIWSKKVNKKENNLAIRSAMAATLNKELAANRGHKVPDNYPFIIDNDITKLEKTKDVKAYLKSVGLEADLKKAEAKKIRPGKGKARGRKYKKKTSALIVTDKECQLTKAGKSIPGVDIITADKLTTQLLAPGAQPGRLTLWTISAIESISKNNLYK